MDYCDFGFEIEMPARLFALLILFFIAMLVLWFILDLKLIKLRREEAKRNKPKEDDLQKLLNKLNDKIIDLANDHSGSEMLQVRKADFHYFKGMILGLMEERKNNNDK